MSETKQVQHHDAPPVSEIEKAHPNVKYAQSAFHRAKPFDLHDGEIREIQDWAHSENPSLLALRPILQRMKRRAWGMGLDDGADTATGNPKQFIERQKELNYSGVMRMLKRLKVPQGRGTAYEKGYTDALGAAYAETDRMRKGLTKDY